ncbi:MULTISPECIES: DUF4231 domain-containing protein [unclassified Blastococcus]
MADPQSQTLLDPDDFPALYRSADTTSLEAQQNFLAALRVRLGGLLAATAGGVIAWSVGSIQVGGLISLVAFLIALAAELYTATVRPDRTWYEGRAAAESAKTLTWRYAVRGESFEDAADGTADRKFLAELNELLQDLDSLQLSVAGGSQITQKMRHLRALDFDSRRAIYLHGRILDQHNWYSRKAKWNKKRAQQWFVASIVFEFAGVIGGALRAFGVLDVDLLGLLGGIAATIIAWVQAKQYQTLATAYAVTALELASVASEAEAVSSEETWGRFVGEAEEAISREHTLWRASRGIRIRQPRIRGA